VVTRQYKGIVVVREESNPNTRRVEIEYQITYIHNGGLLVECLESILQNVYHVRANRVPITATSSPLGQNSFPDSTNRSKGTDSSLSQ
jgi:hypothetical protein